MKLNIKILVPILGLIVLLGCSSNKKNKSPITKDITQEMTAAKILGNPDYLAISYGGYRKKNERDSTYNFRAKRGFKAFTCNGYTDSKNL